MDRWAWNVLRGGFDEAVEKICHTSNVTDGSELIDILTSCFSGRAGTLNRMLLAKSVQEALLTCVNAEPFLTFAQTKIRFTRYIQRRGPGSLPRCFLEYYVHNVVWFRVGSHLQNAAESPNAAITEMKIVERASKEVVNTAWHRLRIQSPLDLKTAERVLKEIQAALNTRI